MKMFPLELLTAKVAVGVPAGGVVARLFGKAVAPAQTVPVTVIGPASAAVARHANPAKTAARIVSFVM